MYVSSMTDVLFSLWPLSPQRKKIFSGGYTLDTKYRIWYKNKCV